MGALEVWAYTNRTPRSVNVGVDPSYGRADQPADAQLVRKAEMYVNFDDGTAVWDAVTGNKPITMAICKDVMRGRRKWQKKKAEG